MSKITSDGLTRSGMGWFIAVHYTCGSSERQRVNVAWITKLLLGQCPAECKLRVSDNYVRTGVPKIKVLRRCRKTSRFSDSVSATVLKWNVQRDCPRDWRRKLERLITCWGCKMEQSVGRNPNLKLPRRTLGKLQFLLWFHNDNLLNRILLCLYVIKT